MPTAVLRDAESSAVVEVCMRARTAGTPRSVLYAAVLGAAAASAVIAAAVRDAPLAAPAGASRIAPFVRGYIATRVVEGPALDTPTAVIPRRLRDIFLPRVSVHLLNLSDNSTSDAVTTDLSGRFTIPAKAGRYRVCWKATGFEPGCGQDIVSVGNTPVHVSTLRINIKKADGTTTVFGHVQLADGASFRLLEPLADINTFGRVALLDAARKEHYEALVNNFGDYVLPQVPAKTDAFLLAQVEKGEIVQEIRPQANLAGAAFHRIDLDIRNAAPRVEPLIPRHASGDDVQVATPGETLELQALAKDPDGDALTFRWRLDPGAGALSATTGDAVKWTLPARAGRYALALIASDGKGGQVRRTLAVPVDTRGVVFSGRVVTAGATPVPKASVSVNGKLTTTNAIGFFRFHVPVRSRYVLNIRKPGFSLVSHVLGRGVVGARYELRRATLANADPAADIDVQDKRSVRDCPGPASLRFDAKIFPAGLKPVWQDGKGNVIAPPKKKEGEPLSLARYRRQDGCGPGIRVRIPANSLVDRNGNAPAGPVQIALSTVDLLSPDQMPGDYTVAQPAGGTRVMESYGAGTIEITRGGKKYNLKSGASAEVTIPVDQAQIAAGGPFPPTIPILFYNEAKGVWREEGSATLQGNVYVAKVKHFSTINADSVKVGQGCVRVDASDPGLPGSFRLQVIVPLGPNVAPRLRDEVIDNTLEKEHAVYNLPVGTNITLAPYDPVSGVPFGTFIVNTGPAQNPTDPNEPIGPPYLACPTTVHLTPQTLPQDPVGGEFLHGLFSFAATTLVETDIPTPGTLSNQLDQATLAYYQNVDPNGTRATLAGVADGFKTHHGFGPGGPSCTGLAAGETCALYANTGDLGFGREMHCKKNGADVACYVTNYGDIDTPDDDDAAAAQGGDGNVTVAMEYAPIEGDPANVPVVKFFVYVNGQRANAANLDGKGARPVPQLCMVCHGGHYPGGPNVTVPPFSNADEVKLGAEFLPFDLHNFTFAAAPFDKASQQAAFKTLNEQVVLATNPGQATQLYVAEMYDGDNGVPANTQEELAVVDDPTAAAGDRWSAQPPKQEMYKHVIGNACRTCHATNPTPSLVFINAKQAIDILGSIEARVCSQHVMPHAKRTHDLFWLSTNRPDTPIVDPHQPGVLEAFGTVFGTPGNGWQGDLCGAFTPGGPPIASQFNDIKTQIFTPLCSGCHQGGTPPGNLNLQSASAYTQLLGAGGLGENSCERPVMKRVQVQPPSANDSFLFRKLDGTHTGLGGCNVAGCSPFGGESGCGQQMPWSPPANGPASANPLSGAQLNLIQSWINAGAPN